MADLDDEDVIFENSPLERYLKEVGFTVVESENVDRLGNQAGETNLNDVVVDRNYFGLKDWISSFNKRYLYLDADKLLSARETYASIVINSGTLSEDDYTFLLQFDPNLFGIPEEDEKKGRSKMFSLLNDCKTESIVSILFLLVAVFIASSYWEFICDHKGSSIGVLLVISILGYYVWNIHSLRAFHYRNVQILKNYTSEVKSFVTIFRKSIMLIQELELISKGYTLVGLGMQIGYQQKDPEGECMRNIYPKLRQSLCDNGMNILVRSCSSMKNMFSTVPFALEVTGVFTCISSDPLSQFGLEEYSQSEQLSLHYLKILQTAIASQQSEFLSRFLLSLSDKARLSEMTFERKNFEHLLSGFYDQLAVVTKALKSLQLSYHLHKCALTFAGDQEIQHGSPNSRPQSKWTHYYTSIHSLELHLKACLTRMQFINTFITDETQSEELTSSISLEHTVKDNAEHIRELESNYNLLKNELNSAICCWEEGFHDLKIISGIDKPETVATQKYIDEEEDQDENSSSVCQASRTEPKEIMGDCVFEGYTDFEDDFGFHQTRLTREDLEKESRSREEGQHLLLELKNVLLTKAKDPLITDKGFVKPYKRQITEDGNINEHSSETGDGQTECLVHDFKVNDDSKGYNNDVRAVNDSKSDNPTNMKEINGEGMRDCKEPLTIKTKQAPLCSQWSSKAFSIAIQEAARSRGNALMEESYGSSDSD